MVKKHYQKNIMGLSVISCVMALGSILISLNISAQISNDTPNGISVGRSDAYENADSGVVTYPATNFDVFQPNTALDMVRQIPGFQLRDNSTDTTRGFGGALGNLYINDRRPTAKQDSLPAILARIPASTVLHIELIRCQIRSIDLRGQSSVVNLVLRDDMPAAIQWKLAFRQTFGHGKPAPDAAISLSHVWRGIEYNIGFDARPSRVGRKGVDDILDSDNVLIEKRLENRENRTIVLKPSLTASSWVGETLFQLNTNYTYEDRSVETYSQRIPQLTALNQSEVFVDDTKYVSAVEAGIDIERSLYSDLTAKGIFLYLQKEEDLNSLQQNFNFSGTRTLLRNADSLNETTEFITRLEFDWSQLNNHLIQANIERAYNVLDGDLEQTDDTGAGPFIVNVPGANSRVEETRWDFLLKDTWILNNLEFDYGIGAEASTIAQTGDAEQKRNFFYIKPHASVSHSSAQGNKTRLRIAREIAQLDLNGFISSTVFEDDDLALGNPDLKPDSTWKMEVSHDKRFSDSSVVRLTVFHHWITDVIDLLPLSANFEAPGNIGNGRRWGLQVEGSMPLDWLRLTGAKLNVKASWQDSSVTDPVTGNKRILSIGIPSTGPIVFNIENKYGYEIDYRQDFQQQRFAWGWIIKERAG